MHMKSAMKSVRLRLFRANCRSDRQFAAERVRSPATNGRFPVSALVAEAKPFDDR
jgi:hypothetical protein